MKKKTFGVLLIILLANSYLFAQTINNQTIKLWRSFDIISNFYVDTVNEDKLVENAIIELIKQLDPHSSYLTPKEVKDMNEPLQGNFEGIGVSFNIFNDTIYVISPIIGGPSEKAGIIAGDRIIKVNGKNVAGIGITNKDVFSYLRGKKGTSVTVSIKRRGEKELIDFPLIRDKIPIYSIDASYRVNNTGYIKLARFASTTTKEFEEAIKKLTATGPLSGLILDLTDNGGGYLEEAVNLVDHFLNKNKLIVYTQGTHSLRNEYKSTEKGMYENGNVVIMIDEGSASASEILSGAIQDWDRGIIVGRRSFGKGLVQRPFPLNDGSMLRLTVARYYTPSGRCIQKAYKPGDEDYDKDLINRYNSGELTNKDSIHFPDSLKTYTLNNKRIIYGGGGIMPDIFIPIDTNSYPAFYRDVIRKGTLNRFVLRYVDENRKEINTRYPNFNTFAENFEVDEKIFSQFVEFSTNDSIKIKQPEVENSKKSISQLIKANIARDIWTSTEFYQIFNTNDPIYRKAFDIMENWDVYKNNLKLGQL